jgi:hypothetical protein
VFKGYSLRKETEEYLAARGLKNALYSINAADARDELFDDLAPCPFQVNFGCMTVIPTVLPDMMFVTCQCYIDFLIPFRLTYGRYVDTCALVYFAIAFN